MPSKPHRSGLSTAQVERLLSAARDGPTLFARDISGAVTWLLAGHERVMLYRLVAEVGLQPQELPTLTPGDFRLGDALPHVLLGMFALPARQRLRLPVCDSFAAHAHEFLRECDDEAALFQLAGAECFDEILRFDANAAELLREEVSLASLAVAFAARAARKRGKYQHWSAAAVEVCS